MLKRLINRVTGKRLAPLANYRYSFDEVNQHIIAGWAVNSKLPNHHPVIDVYANGELVWQAHSNRDRADLQEAGIGPFAFELVPDLSLIDNDVDAVEIRIDGHEVPESPYPFSRSVSSSCIKLNIDRCDLNGVVGWALDESDPTQRLEISVCCSDNEIARGEAADERPDLVVANSRDGKHGFSLDIRNTSSITPDGKVEIKVLGTDVVEYAVLNMTEKERSSLEFNHKYADELLELEKLVNESRESMLSQIEELNNASNTGSLNNAVNVCVNTIAEQNARLAVIEKILLKKLGE